MNVQNNYHNDMLACLTGHTLPELFSAAQVDSDLLFEKYVRSDLLALIQETIEEDLELGVAGRDEFDLLEKALFLSSYPAYQGDCLVKMAAILHNNELLFSAKGKLNPDMAPGYFGSLVQKCSEIIKDVRSAFPDADAAADILESYGDVEELSAAASSALQIMALAACSYHGLTMHLEARIATAGPWVADMADQYGYHPHFAEIFFDYYDQCGEILEEFLALPSEIVKQGALNFLETFAEDAESITSEELARFLLTTHILSLYEALESDDGPELDDDQRNTLAFLAATVSKSLLNDGHDMDMVMDLAEKALLFACDETLIPALLLQIALLLNSVEDLDFDEDEIPLELIPGSLAKSALPYARFSDALTDDSGEDDGSKRLESFFCAAGLNGINYVISKAYTCQQLFEALTDKYTDFSDEVDEEMVEKAIESWEIETDDDPQDFLASIFECYDDFAFKLQMLERPLRKLQDYRKLND